MRFINRYARARYTVRPTYFKHHGPGQKEKVAGLHVQFSNNVYDSEQAQQLEGFSNKEREEIDTYLSNHGDFGTTLHYLGEVEASAAPEPSDTLHCLFMVTGPDGVQMCGERVDVEGDYCDKHAAQLKTPVKGARARARADV